LFSGIDTSRRILQETVEPEKASTFSKALVSTNINAQWICIEKQLVGTFACQISLKKIGMVRDRFVSILNQAQAISMPHRGGYNYFFILLFQ